MIVNERRQVRPCLEHRIGRASRDLVTDGLPERTIRAHQPVEFVLGIAHVVRLAHRVHCVFHLLLDIPIVGVAVVEQRVNTHGQYALLEERPLVRAVKRITVTLLFRLRQVLLRERAVIIVVARLRTGVCERANGPAYLFAHSDLVSIQHVEHDPRPMLPTALMGYAIQQPSTYVFRQGHELVACLARSQCRHDCVVERNLSRGHGIVSGLNVTAKRDFCELICDGVRCVLADFSASKSHEISPITYGFRDRMVVKPYGYAAHTGPHLGTFQSKLFCSFTTTIHWSQSLSQRCIALAE